MFPILDGDPGWTSWLFERSPYVGPFVVLLLCGVGLPLPEEVTLIGSGILLHRERVEFLPITAVCAAAILIGDSIPYWVGRRYGPAVLRVPWVARVMHAERMEVIERRFAQHGSWVVFSCRFLAGARIPGYFTAGTLGMGYLRFLLLDVIGVLISVPVSIWLGKVFGGSVEELHRRVGNLHIVLAFALVSLVLVLLGHAWVRRRWRNAQAAGGGSGGASGSGSGGASGDGPERPPD